jgi:hypothetical protein
MSCSAGTVRLCLCMAVSGMATVVRRDAFQKVGLSFGPTKSSGIEFEIPNLLGLSKRWVGGFLQFGNAKLKTLTVSALVWKNLWVVERSCVDDHTTACIEG